MSIVERAIKEQMSLQGAVNFLTSFGANLPPDELSALLDYVSKHADYPPVHLGAAIVSVLGEREVYPILTCYYTKLMCDAKFVTLSLAWVFAHCSDEQVLQIAEAITDKTKTVNFTHINAVELRFYLFSMATNTKQIEGLSAMIAAIKKEWGIA